MPGSPPLWLQLSSPLPFHHTVKQPLFQIGPGKDPSNDPHRHQGRAQAGKPDPGRSAEVQAPVEADGVGVHEKQVSLSERLDFRRSGVTDRETGDACSQDQETQGQGHLQGGREEPEAVICTVWCSVLFPSC